MRRFLYSLSLGAAMVCVGIPASAQTSAPSAQQLRIDPTLSYQGLISGKDGQPVSDGDYQITVTLYTDQDGTHPVWSGHYTTRVNRGVFSVLLGSKENPLPSPSTMVWE